MRVNRGEFRLVDERRRGRRVYVHLLMWWLTCPAAPPTDAYATGQALFTLRELGLPAANPTIRRGVAFLVETQAKDGSWFVKSRAMKFQPYFESGFPYGHDQWISQSGTAWATLALSVAAPEPSVAVIR
jgi:hypothetical protein